MKVLLWILGILATLFIIIYVTLFTPLGNTIVRPIIESKVNEKTKLNAKLQTFVLTNNYIELTLLLDDKNSLHVKGNYSLFSKTFDLFYDVKLQELQSLEPLMQARLHGPLFTNGEIKGNEQKFSVTGISDIFKSNTVYKIEVSDFAVTSVVAKMKGARLKELLKMLGKQPYAQAALNLNVNFKDIRAHHLDGDLLLHVNDSKIDYVMLQKEFGIDLPHTNFSIQAKAKLKGDEVIYETVFVSNLANMTSQGLITPKPLSLDLDYNANIKELALLRPLLKAPLRGALNIEGNVKGSKKSLHVNGKSDVGASETAFDVLLKNFKMFSLNADIKHLDLARVLFMVSQPHYADAQADVKIQMNDTAKGSITTQIKNGVLDSSVISQAYGVKDLPRIRFETNSISEIKAGTISTMADVKSDLADLHVKEANYNIAQGLLTSDYRLDIPELGKFRFVTKRELKGPLSVNGDVNAGKENFALNAHCDIFEGKVDAQFANDRLSADFDALNTLPILKMFEYPQIFEAKALGKIVYDLKTQKGNLDAKLRDGRFTDNQMANLIKQYTRTDLYQERFTGDVKADIQKDDINADIHLNSNNAKIDTKELKINTQKSLIDATIRVEANKNPLTLTLNGNINKPRIGIDATELLQKEAGKEINKFLKGLF